MFKNQFVKWTVAAAAVGTATYALVFKDGYQQVGISSASNSTSKPSAEKQLWSCSMHPWVIRDQPGTCPICHMTLVPMHTHSEHAVTMASSAADVIVDPAIVQNMGIRTAQAKRESLQRSLHALGMIEVPETSMHDVNPRVSGWITKLYANQDGMHIHKNDPLYELYSPELKTAAEELVWAAASGQSQGKSVVDSSWQRLRLMGVAPQDIDDIVANRKVPEAIVFRSPVSGAVQDKAVVEGSAVSAGMKIMQIDDHSKLWLVAKVFAPDMSAVQVGQLADAAIDGLPGETFRGTVSFVRPHLDMDTRSLVVRIELDNSSGELRPGMFGTADIDAQPIADAVVIPREAVLDSGDRQTVFIVKESGHFEPRTVEVGVGGEEEKVQIVRGLEPGETVVTSGQFLLDVESRRNEAMQKFLASGTEGK